MKAVRPDPEDALRRGLLAASALALASGTGWASGQTAATGDTIQWPALTLIDGGTLQPVAWADMAAVVVFWATWCGFCRRHNAHIDRLHREAAGQHLRVLGVAMDGDAASLRHYMQNNGYHFPVAVGHAALRERFSTRRIIPLTGAVDRRGRLRMVIPGEMAEADVLSLAALAQSPARP